VDFIMLAKSNILPSLFCIKTERQYFKSCRCFIVSCLEGNL
jgi:hypothetical protein